ncbi:MAG TPA: hypothetical protein PLO07_05845 [Rubrivivax sp.]|nr:hypothetical protein [Rubrivivax sp.]
MAAAKAMWPGWTTSRARWRLLWALLASLTLPWLAGEMAKTFHQPGLDDDAQRNQMLIDFLVIGGSLWALTMVLLCTFGCWISAVMHGPRRDGDPFPAGQGRPHGDD